MTVRNTKRLMLVVIALLVLVSALNLGLVVFLRPERRIDYFEILMPLFMVVIFAGTWRRLSALEAEHGPDYVQPSPPYARKLVIAAALVALVLGGVAGYLMVALR